MMPRFLPNENKVGEETTPPLLNGAAPEDENAPPFANAAVPLMLARTEFISEEITLSMGANALFRAIVEIRCAMVRRVSSKLFPDTTAFLIVDENIRPKSFVLS